jgi:hypothetical protein
MFSYGIHQRSGVLRGEHYIRRILRRECAFSLHVAGVKRAAGRRLRTIMTCVGPLRRHQHREILEPDQPSSIAMIVKMILRNRLASLEVSKVSSRGTKVSCLMVSHDSPRIHDAMRLTASAFPGVPSAADDGTPRSSPGTAAS